MKIKSTLSWIAISFAGAFAGFYADLGTGLSYSTFEVEDKPYYVSEEDYHKVYSDSVDGTIKVDSDRQKFTGFGPGFDLKVGYAWEYGALFADLGLILGFGSHEGDHYEADECSGRACVTHEKYELQQSSSTRFNVAGGFMLTPFGGSEAMSRMSGFYFAASCGLFVVGTSSDDSQRANYRSALGEYGLGLQVEIGQKWIIAGRWDTGFSVIGTWDLAGPYQQGIGPANFYTIGAMIHVSRH